MKHLFVPSKLALLAKKKGFDEKCLAAYYPIQNNELRSYEQGDLMDLKGYKPSDFNSEHLLSAPLYQQLVDWFREKHNLHISIDSVGGNWYFSLHKFDAMETKQLTETLIRCIYYYENYDDAITEAFNYIQP